MDISFSDRLGELMKKAGMTQADLAGKIGVSQNTISRYIHDGRTPDCTCLGKIADLFNVTTDYLLGRAVPEKEYRTVGDIARAINLLLPYAWMNVDTSKIESERIEVIFHNKALASYFLKRGEAERALSALNNPAMVADVIAALDAQEMKKMDSIPADEAFNPLDEL